MATCTSACQSEDINGDCFNQVSLSHDMPRRLRVQLLYGTESLEFDARISGAELPVDRADSLVAFFC